MKAKFFSIICLTILLAGCTKNINESVSHNESTDTIQTNDIKDDNTIVASAEISSNDIFPPEGITAPTIPIQLSTHEYETGEAVPAGNHVECFELDGIRYVESLECGYFDFVIEDDRNIVVEGEPEYEDYKVVQALRNLYSLEYVGLSHINEHLFRYGDDLLAIVKSPAAKIQSVYFKDYDYGENQFYFARIYEPYDFN